MPKLAIIGLGLIGGSLGLALKRADLTNLEIAGFDAEWGVASRAKRLGVIDTEPRDLPSTVEGAALVVIATPISRVAEVFEKIAPSLGEGAVVTDTASTKRGVLEDAQRLLPERVSFVGGHPIAGKEHSGLDAAEAGLFEGRAWAMTPSLHATEKAIKAVENMILLTGAQPLVIDADEHDSYMAAVSHLPLVVSTALFSLALGSNAWEDLGMLAGPGFRDLTRLASTDHELSRDIIASNRDNVLHWLDRMIEELSTTRSLIADPERGDALAQLFESVRNARDEFIESPPVRAPRETGTRQSARDTFMSVMFGDLLMRGAKNMEKQFEDIEKRSKPKREERR
ncbi:MAG: prephenate dehydrogenase/arogenate dehydrogenase family protein [Dehalococcoidia bacterium]